MRAPVRWVWMDAKRGTHEESIGEGNRLAHYSDEDQIG